MSITASKSDLEDFSYMSRLSTLYGLIYHFTKFVTFNVYGLVNYESKIYTAYIINYKSKIYTAYSILNYGRCFGKLEASFDLVLSLKFGRFSKSAGRQPVFTLATDRTVQISKPKISQYFGSN